MVQAALSTRGCDIAFIRQIFGLGRRSQPPFFSDRLRGRRAPLTGGHAGRFHHGAGGHRTRLQVA